MTKINKDMLIGNAVKTNPNAAKVMFEYGLHCVGCCGAAMETIEAGAKMHGLTDKQIDEMIEKINEGEKEDE